MIRPVRRQRRPLRPLSRLAGLGDYFDGLHTWHYDASINGYVNESGAPSQPAPTPTPTPIATTLGPSYGSTPNASGGYTYNADSNTLLIANITGQGIDGATRDLNSNFYATLDAAKRFALALGGSVVIDPTSARFDTSAPMYAIQLGNGATVNAGALAQILGNDAAYANANVKSGAIADLLGADYQPGIAQALAAGTPIELTAADYTPAGYSVPLWQAPAPRPRPTRPTPPAPPPPAPPPPPPRPPRPGPPPRAGSPPRGGSGFQKAPPPAAGNAAEADR